VADGVGPAYAGITPLLAVVTSCGTLSTLTKVPDMVPITTIGTS